MNCFKKADIMSFDDPHVELVPDDDAALNMLELVERVAGLNISAKELEEFVQIDDEDSPVFVGQVLNDVNELLEGINNNEFKQTEPEDDSDADEVDAPNEGAYELEGFHSCYKKLLIIKDQVQCQANFASIGAGDEYDDLVRAFDKLESKMRRLSNLEQRQKSRRQLTIHDCFNE